MLPWRLSVLVNSLLDSDWAWTYVVTQGGVPLFLIVLDNLGDENLSRFIKVTELRNLDRNGYKQNVFMQVPEIPLQSYVK